MQRFLVCCLLLLGLTHTALASDLIHCGDKLLSAVLASEEIDSTLYSYCRTQGLEFSSDEAGLLDNITIYKDETLDRAYAIQRFLVATKQQLEKPTLNFSSIEQLTDQLELDHQQKSLSLWERFVEWLKSFRKDAPENEYKWLDKLMDWLSQIDMPDWFVTLLFRGSIILLLLMAIVFIVYEFHQNGLFRKRKHTQRSAQKQLSDSDINTLQNLDWNGIQSQPLGIRFRAMFAFLINKLTELNHLPDDRSLTNLELLRCFTKQNHTKTQSFSNALILFADHVYGNKVIDANAVDTMYSHIDEIISVDE